jgi:hypothetical protein
LREALLFVQHRRTIIVPNEGFMRALREWDAHLFEGAPWPHDTEDEVLLSLLREQTAPVDYRQIAERLGPTVHIDGPLESFPLRASVTGEGSAIVTAAGGCATAAGEGSGAAAALPESPDSTKKEEDHRVEQEKEEVKEGTIQGQQ